MNKNKSQLKSTNYLLIPRDSMQEPTVEVVQNKGMDDQSRRLSVGLGLWLALPASQAWKTCYAALSRMCLKEIPRKWRKAESIMLW